MRGPLRDLSIPYHRPTPRAVVREDEEDIPIVDWIRFRYKDPPGPGFVGISNA